MNEIKTDEIKQKVRRLFEYMINWTANQLYYDGILISNIVLTDEYDFILYYYEDYSILQYIGIRLNNNDDIYDFINNIILYVKDEEISSKMKRHVYE